MLRTWFLLTLAYGIGFCIAVPSVVIYVLISEGRIPKDFSAVFGVYLFFYILSLFAMWALSALSQESEFFYRIWSRLSFFKRALLSHGIMILISGVIVALITIKSFSDLFLAIGSLALFTSPVVLGLVIANWLMHATAGLSQFKRKVMVKERPPKTLDFAEYGKWVVVGQDYAIDTIQRVLAANTKLADRGDPRRNSILASFLFVGPTGVGKTETAKALASWLRQDGYDFIRIDANQFATEETVWTLLGSPKGYIGSETPGLLPAAISQNPKQVILIDEIEKADQRLYQAMLQLLDEGYVIERSTGYAYYLSRAIVIFTSNLENKRIAEIMETLSDPIEIDIAVRKILESAVIEFSPYRSFKITPEFLGRIDAVVPFRSLGFEDLVQIAYRELRRLGENVDIDFARALTQKYYPIAKEYGVRYFLKKITEDVLSQ
uniref:ATP-dependent Clp protease ATP-binding subunit n=1 Tax=Thermocrinis ruber TaxID=75906 RepID=A0A7C5X5D9_9AQUI